LHQAMPYQWLESLDNMNKLDVDFIVPGHGEVCDKSGIKKMRADISMWIDSVKDALTRGWTLEETQARINLLDRYQIEPARLVFSQNIQKNNLANLYTQLK